MITAKQQKQKVINGEPSKSITSQNTIETGKENYFKRTEIEESPFILIEEEKGSYITLGQHRITGIYETPEEAKNAIKHPTWQTLIAVMGIVAEITIKEQLKSK